MKRSQWRKPYRIKKKKSVLKKKWFWRLVLLLVFTGEVFYIIFFFSYFQIKEVNISGLPASATLEALQAGNIKVETGSIFLIDSKKIIENILNNFPQIAEVKINRKFPDRLNLTITERVAVANFCLPAVALAKVGEDECFLIDKEGIVFESVSDKLGLIVTKPSLIELKGPGDRVLESNFVSSILDIESKLKDDLKIAINEISVVSEDRLDIKTAEGWQIYFNPKNDLSWQLTKLKAVLEKEIPSENRRKLEYIDLRFGNLAPYKYR